MNRIHKFLSVATALISLAPVGAFAQTVLNGNGSGGFGGPLGGGALTITDNTSTGMIQFALHTGNGGGFNDIAFYLSTGTTTTGVSDTSSITDTGDEGRISISGNSNVTGKSLVNFASGFSANFAVALDANGNANLFQIVSGQGYLTYVDGAHYTNPSTGNYGFSISGADLGLAQNSNATIGIVATLSNSNADNSNPSGAFYRSNETIGASNVDNNSQGNLGNTGTLTYSGFDTFVTQVPEPSTWLAGGLLVAAAGWTASRSRRLAA